MAAKLPRAASATAKADLRVAEIAARQHGVIAYAQLVEAGLDHRAISRRRAAGRLHRIYRMAYAVGHPAISEHGRWMAAVLAGGPGALLSHWSLARLHGLRVTDDRPHVSAPRRNLSAIKGVVLHRPRSLADADRVVVDRIPATSIFRMLLDIAPGLSKARLLSAIEQLERRHRPDWSQARELCDRVRGHHGRRRLLSALDESVLFPEFTRSDLEVDFLRACDEAGVRRPAMNTVVSGYEVDALWRESMTIVELDTFEFHGSCAAFERDRQRDSALQLLGFRTFRITGFRLASHRAETIEFLQRIAHSR